MKKKILLIAVVIFISIGLLSISKVVQDKYLKGDIAVEQSKQLAEKSKVDSTQKDVLEDADSKTNKPIVTNKSEVDEKTEIDKKAETQPKEDSKPIEKKVPSKENVTPAKDVPKAPTIKVPEPKKDPNFTVKDDVADKVILSINSNIENKTVAQVTFDALDRNSISYKSTGRSEAVYFTMIDGLKARDAGPLSGWCYYVNGTKSSVSCGAYKLKAGDVVQWKYLKDGVNN